MISQEQLAHVITEQNQAGYGCKAEVVRRYAAIFGISYGCLYRAISNARARDREQRADKGKRMNPEIDNWTETLWKVKLRGPEEAGMLATDQALTLALKQGLVPREAGEVPVSSFNRIARDLHLNRDGGRWCRFQAKYPNLLHQIDASTSKFFYVHRRLPDEERILRLHRPAAHYKNKPVPVRERPWIYGVVDDHSGYQLARYTTAEGESAADAVLFLQYAWGMKENPRIPFRGLPRLVYMDNGPLAKAAPTKDFLKRLGITTILRKPYNKRAGGKIERPWRTLWSRFERPFMALDNWQKFEIPLSELNRQLVNYLIEQNARAHRYEKEITREQAWLRVMLRGGVLDIPPQALATIFERHERVVKGGYFSLHNIVYEVPQMTEGKVYVNEGVFDDRLIVEDKKTRQKYEVKLFKPLSFGQRIEQIQTEAEKLAEADDIRISELLYDQTPETNIVNLPVRGQEVELIDPLAVPAIQNTEQGEKLFASPRERYEWLLERQGADDELPESEIQFMREFEGGEEYRQYAGTYRRRKQFWQRRRAVTCPGRTGDLYREDCAHEKYYGGLEGGCGRGNC